MVTEMVKGKTIDEALEITKETVSNELDGLPAQKMHCSNLGADALKKAIQDYRSKGKGEKNVKKEEKKEKVTKKVKKKVKKDS